MIMLRKLSYLLLMASTFTATAVYAADSADYPACPTGGALLNIVVDNETGNPQTITVKGGLSEPSCSLSGLASSYSQSFTCATGITTCGILSGLVSGIWSHQIYNGVQQQAQKSILIAKDPNGINNSIRWTVFKSIVTVDNPFDDTATCPSVAPNHTCTLRGAIIAANSAPSPALVQFDPSVFPSGTQTIIKLSNTASLQIGSHVMVDGADTDGNPAFVGNPYDTSILFPRVLQLPQIGSGFSFIGQQSTIQGLLIERPQLATGATPGDVVFFSGSNSTQNTVFNVKINGGGDAVKDKTAGQDCIGTGNDAGSSVEMANHVSHTELEYCLDKAVKSAYGSWVIVHNSWAHQSIGGGFQATLSGALEADYNIVEQSGSNVSTVVYPSANGMSSHGANSGTPTVPSILNTTANIIRNNALRGLTAETTYANASINGDFSCGNLNGMTLLAGAGAGASRVTVRGCTFIYNSNGVVIGDAQSSGDFGTDSSDANAGNNAFTQNSMDFANDNGADTIAAVWNQWQGCATKNTCNPHIKGPVNYTDWQPYAGTVEQLPMSVTGFYPTKARSNDIIHILGAGFNAVDGFTAGMNCMADFNSCDSDFNPMNGVCVYYQLPNATQPIKPRVVSITPTDIGIQGIGLTCSQPVTIVVKRLDNSSASSKVITASGTFCTNANDSF